MKKPLFITVALMALGMLLQSCDQFYFRSPQPVDEVNIETFPEAIRGLYMDQNDSIIFGADYFLSVDYTEKKIPQAEVDTSGSYILKDQKIYLLDKDEEIKLKGGYPYTVKEDTLYFSERSIIEIALGKKAFLRKVSGNNYMLNIKEEYEWWTLIFMEVKADGAIVARYINEEDLEKIPGLKKIYEGDGDHYLEVNWTSASLNELLQSGIFSDTLLSVNSHNKIPLKE